MIELLEIHFEKKRVNRGSGLGLDVPCIYKLCGDQKAIAWTEKKILIITDRTLMRKRLNDKENTRRGGGGGGGGGDG